MILLETFSTLQEASIVQGMLEAHGIPSVIRNNDNLYVPIFGGVDLYVSPENLNEAKKLLNEHED